MKKILFFVLGLGFLVSCSPKIVSVGEEDLAQYRTQYQYQREVYTGADANQIVEIPLEYDSTTQEYHVTVALNKFLDTKPGFIPTEPRVLDMMGWRIQIYRGRSQVEASRARQRCYDIFSTKLTPYMKYRAPTYRVTVGDFLEPYEYQPYLKILKREFPSAIPVPERIRIVVQGNPQYDQDGVPAPVPIKNENQRDNKNK